MKLLALLVVLAAAAHAEDDVAVDNIDTVNVTTSSTTFTTATTTTAAITGEPVEAKNPALLRVVRVVDGTANVRSMRPFL
jgi:hypothetical protein